MSHARWRKDTQGGLAKHKKVSEHNFWGKTKQSKIKTKSTKRRNNALWKQINKNKKHTWKHKAKQKKPSQNTTNQYQQTPQQKKKKSHKIIIQTKPKVF